MYSQELKKYIEDRNYMLGGDDLLFVISIEHHPQLNHIKYDPFNNRYEMWDNDGNYFNFGVILYEEAKEKGLVKCKNIKNNY